LLYNEVMNIPHFQPGGGMIEIDSGLIDALHNGYPPLGWEGDRNLFLAWNRQTQRMELWRHSDRGDGKAHLIMRSKPGVRVADMNIILFLVQHDTRRGYDPVKEYKEHNRKREADLMSAQRDKMGEAAERLYHGFQKDLGQHLTGSTRDFMPLPEAPWKKDKDAE
jgi:hypothetical protein